MMYLIMWYLSGLLGTYYCYYDSVLKGRDNKCPTPRSILGILALALLGPVILLASIFAFICSCAEKHLNSGWWSTPICKPKSKKTGWICIIKDHKTLYNGCKEDCPNWLYEEYRLRETGTYHQEI